MGWRNAAALTLVASLAGCMTMPDQSSPAYNAGFADGCATARAESLPVPMEPQRNAALYGSDANYRGGWLAGHNFCRQNEPRGPL